MSNLFSSSNVVIGMIHLLPLPTSPLFEGDLKGIYERALWEAEVLESVGVDGLIVENFGDLPYQAREPETVVIALMASVTREIVRSVKIPVGINVQFNAWQAEMAIAYACGANFIRAEVFVDTVVSTQGIIAPCAAELTRYRKQLGASVQIFADVQTKHTANLIPQSLVKSALDAQAAGADALIVTGEATGKATPLSAIQEVKEAVRLPVYAGSGTTVQNVSDILKTANGVIVGSALKEDGITTNRISPERAQEFIRVVRSRS